MKIPQTFRAAPAPEPRNDRLSFPFPFLQTRAELREVTLAVIGLVPANQIAELQDHRIVDAVEDRRSIPPADH